MKKQEKSTKEKILRSAAELFAKKGFREVTHRELANHGNFNAALINYYFSSKDKLYEEACNYALEITSEKYYSEPKDISDTEKKILHMVTARFNAILDTGPGGWFPRLMYHIMSSNLSIQDSIRKTYITIVRKNLTELISTYFELPVDNNLVIMTAHNLSGHFISLNIARAKQKMLFQKKKLTDEEKEEIILYTSEYIKGALRHLKNISLTSHEKLNNKTTK